MAEDLRPSRHEMGWTVERQRGFLIALAETGSVTLAAKSVGMSARSAYHLRMREGHDPFRIAWMEALTQALLNLQCIAIDRAVHGSSRQVWKNGELVSEEIVPSDRLLIWLLERLGPPEDFILFPSGLSVIEPYLHETNLTDAPQLRKRRRSPNRTANTATPRARTRKTVTTVTTVGKSARKSAGNPGGKARVSTRPRRQNQPAPNAPISASGRRKQIRNAPKA